MNTTTTTNTTSTSDVILNRMETAYRDFLSLIWFLIKKAVACVVLFLVTACGAYFGISYYHAEQDTIDHELFPLTAAEVDNAEQIIRLASDYMRQVEYDHSVETETPAK